MEDRIRYLLSLESLSVHKQIVHSYDPTIMNYLRLIRKEPNTFDIDHFTEILEIYSSDKEKFARYGEMIKVVNQLKDRKLIKHSIKKGNEVTLKGRWHMVVQNSSWTFWGIIIAIIALLIATLSLIQQARSGL